MQRIRVGLTGLACVFLLVMLATAILRVADNGDGTGASSAPLINAPAPAEPLAQLGVVPGNIPAPEVTPAATTPAAAASVPGPASESAPATTAGDRAAAPAPATKAPGAQR